MEMHLKVFSFWVGHMLPEFLVEMSSDRLQCIWLHGSPNSTNFQYLELCTKDGVQPTQN